MPDVRPAIAIITRITRIDLSCQGDMNLSLSVLIVIAMAVCSPSGLVRGALVAVHGAYQSRDFLFLDEKCRDLMKVCRD